MDDKPKHQFHGSGSGTNGPQVTIDKASQQSPSGQPAQPISGPHKEMAPLSGMTETIRPTEQQPSLSKEVVDAGLKESQNPELPHIPHEVRKAGVEHAKETTIHHVEPQGTVQLPQITQQQAVVLKKKSSVKDAARWFAVFVMRQFDKIAYQKLVTKS